MGNNGSTDKKSTAIPFDLEKERIRQRRNCMQLGSGAGTSALAFSGGGIRSATFNLGVLQGLNKSPGQSGTNLLRQFDYLSTVSGGGFIGSFFVSLFAAARLDKAKTSDVDTANLAYKVLEEEPPGRLRGSVFSTPDAPGQAPLAWLRENGRYMAPTGAGDIMYAAGLAVRNWFSLQYVIGTVLLTLFTAMALAHVWIMHNGFHEKMPLASGFFQTVEFNGTQIWLSPFWSLLIPLLGTWLIPAGLAFWMTHPGNNKSVSSEPGLFSIAAIGDLFIGLSILAGAYYYQCRGIPSHWESHIKAAETIGWITLIAVPWYWMTAMGSASIGAQRVALTRIFAMGLQFAFLLVVFGLVHAVAQNLYSVSVAGSASGSAAALAVAAWLAQKIAKLLDGGSGSGKFLKLPAEALVGIAGLSLLFAITLFWAIVVLLVMWGGSPPIMEKLGNAAGKEIMWVLGIVGCASLALTIFSGQFLGFLNLSTLQGLYSGKLTRAYLGASNGQRFLKGNENYRSAAEPAPGDHMSHSDYYRNPLAPIHIINVCLNQNVDPLEQLVQRDRKGKPLSVLPSGFTIDGHHYELPGSNGRSEVLSQLTVGEWIGVSGAAFSTGMGSRNSIAYSLLMGLTNVRLGRWWSSGTYTDPASSQVGSFAKNIGRLAGRAFPTQTYLLNELTSTFHGTRRWLHYLSDGGHFENTAIYELLRRERDIRLIVAADCGCDPHYQFEDLANLIRLARIDFGIEIEIDTKAASTPQLSEVFGTLEQFQGNARENAGKCALLLNVYHPGAGKDKPGGRIVVIKPRLTAGLPVDLQHYAKTHHEFPQESTLDQFYDESQWESYRKLGLELSRRVFDSPDPDYRRALWELLGN